YLSSWAAFRWQNVWLALIPGGAILLSNISYLSEQFSLAFVVFLFGGALLITRLHLVERAKAWREGSTPYPPFLSLSVLHATFWVALLLMGLAWLMPQANEAEALESLWRRATAPVTERVEGLSRLFAGVNSRRVVSIHRFGDILPFLGHIGELPGTLVLDVTTEPLGQPRYLRAQAYYLYTPTGWKQGTSQRRWLERHEITEVDESLAERQTVTIQVIATGQTGNTVFTIGQPRRVDRPVQLEYLMGAYDWSGVRQGDVTGLEAEDRLEEGATYESVGTVSIASEEDLRGAGADYPGWVSGRYLQLPEDFPASVSNLARELTRFAPTPYDKATTIEAYLRAIPYDLDMPEPPHGQDAVEYFLFEARRGYFDYHASAMVVMLRSVDIPARLAVGYVLRPEERDVSTDRYLVSEQSAFAWPEVYFPRYGWVEFNPTPSLPPVERSGLGLAGSSSLSDADEVPDLGLGLEDLSGAFPGEEGTASKDVTGGGASSDRGRWALIGVAAGLAVLAASTAAGAGYAWLRGLAGLEPPARLWAQTVRLASWARLPPDPTQTPREFARTLRTQVPGVGEVDRLADAYVWYRFGRRRPDGAEQARLEGAWRDARGALLRRLLRLR
ncbi:MAG: hypothetical protein A2148_00135, partial [Chloroflexi bacterium RBG_16_68_14]